MVVRGNFGFQCNVQSLFFVQGKVEIVLLLRNIVEIKALFLNTGLYLCCALNLAQNKFIYCSN